MAWDKNTTEKFEQLRAALLAAFPSFDALNELVLFELGEHLAHIAGDRSQPVPSIVLQLIVWADASGREQELVNNAYKKNPRNAKLQDYARKYAPHLTNTSSLRSPASLPEPSSWKNAVSPPPYENRQAVPKGQPNSSSSFGPPPDASLLLHPTTFNTNQNEVTPPPLTSAFGTSRTRSVSSRPDSTLLVNAQEPFMLAVSDPKGVHLACLGANGILRLYKDIASGSPIFSYDYHTGTSSTSCLALSPDGQHIALVYRNQNTTVTIIDVIAKTEIMTYKHHGSEVVALAWSFDGSFIASAGKEGFVHVWSMSNRMSPGPQQKHNNRGLVSCLCWSHNGYIASASQNRVSIWNGHNSDDQLPSFTTSHRQNITALTWSPDGQRIAVTSSSFVYIHSLHAGGSIIENLDDALPSTIVAFAWSPDGNAIVSAGKDIPLRIRDSTSKKMCSSFEEIPQHTLAIIWKKPEEIIAVSVEGCIRLWKYNGTR